MPTALQQTESFGATRRVSGAGYGWRDWLVQRVTAALIAFFTLALLLRWLLAGEMNYDVWAATFSPVAMKALASAVWLALTYHVWVGARDIWMDYVVRHMVLRLALHAFTLVWLGGCGVWALFALWSA